MPRFSFAFTEYQSSEYDRLFRKYNPMVGMTVSVAVAVEESLKG